jgi:hypothetical protein
MKVNVRKCEWLLPFIFLAVSSCSFDHNSTPTQTNSSTQSNLTIKNPTGDSQPVQTNPPNGPYSNVSLTPILSWSGTADSYDVFIEQSNGITDPSVRVNQQALTTTNYSITGSAALKLNTTYLWKVRAYMNNSGQYTDSKVITFTTIVNINTGPSGYVMTLNDIQVEKPNHVIDILFQVSQNDLGSTGLTASDFEVYEDGELASSSESVITVTKVPNIPFELQSIILIDNSQSLTPDLLSIQNAANTLISTITGITIPNVTQTMEIDYFSDVLQTVFAGTETGTGAGARIQVEASTAINRGGLGIPQGVMSTDFYGSVVKDASLLKSSYSLSGIKLGVMFILSDGNDTQGSSNLASAVNAVGNNLVYTIGFGAEMRPDILTEVGSAGFFDATSANGFSFLQNSFLSLTNKLADYANSFYKLSYTSPKRGTVNHSIIIKLKGVQDAAIQTNYMGW